MEWRFLGGHQRRVEPLVFLPREGTVQIIPFPVVHAAGGRGRGPVRRNFFICSVCGDCKIRDFVRARIGARPPQAPRPAGGAEHFRPVDALGQDDGTDRVVEIQMPRADQRGNVLGERFRCQRPRGDDERIHRRIVGNARHFIAHQRDQRM